MKIFNKICVSALVVFAFASCGDESVTNSDSSSVLSSAVLESSSSSENALESSSSQIELSTIINEDSTITDFRDMKTYKVMKIGKQIWMAENLKYSPEGKTCKSGKGDECLYTWAEAMGADLAYNKQLLNIKDTNDYQGLCPAGWRVPTVSEAEEMLKVLKFMSDTQFDNVFFCNTIVTEDKVTHEGNDIVYDDYCENMGAGGRSNGFNMHLSGFSSGLWLANEDPCSFISSTAGLIYFWEHDVSVFALGSSKGAEYNLRCVMKDSI